MRLNPLVVLSRGSAGSAPNPPAPFPEREGGASVRFAHFLRAPKARVFPPSLSGKGARGLGLVLALTLISLSAHAVETPPPYRSADEGQRPQGSGTRLLPDQFLRGYDPITVYYGDDEGPARGPADDGSKRLRIKPEWPGAWFWTDKRTLQFRPAEPWPALARFAVESGKERRILTTMMSAPSSMSPSPDSDNLSPFRALTITFPQTLPLDSLKQMIHLEIRDLPGLADSAKKVIKDFTLTQLPRGTHRDAAVYAITLKEDVPEGKQLRIDVSLALGDQGRTLWTGRLNTRTPFHIQSVRCGSSEFPLAGGGSTPKDMALACGNQGELPQLVFSAPLKEVSLTALSKLVRLEPAVDDLGLEVYGSRLGLKGKFVPDTLYRMRLEGAPIKDESGRDLRDPGKVEVFFYRGWKTPFLRFSQSTAIVEANGPRMVPLAGYGDPRADVRVYRVDPLFPGLWPFPATPVAINEETAPPFPGEEPQVKERERYDTVSLMKHIRLLGSPLVSKVVDLPLTKKTGTTKFGLDIGALLDPVVGAKKPGTYLVGVRRLTNDPVRTYMRVQVTNLSLSAAEERDRVVFFVRTIDKVEPVRGAKITIDGTKRVKEFGRENYVPDTVTVTTDGDGKAAVSTLKDWTAIKRVVVTSGDDLLLLDPNEAPPKFASNHWSSSAQWLDWLMQPPPEPVNDKTLGFVFTERAIYRPGETVFVKGYVRRKIGGNLQSPGDASAYGLKIEGPGGQTWSLPLKFTALAGFAGEFKEKDVPTGDYSAVVFQQKPYQEIARRPFKIEAYRIPTFEVQLSSSPTVPLDAPFKVKAVARYYAGGNVANQPIAWTVTQSPYYYVPQGKPGYFFASSTQFSRQGTARPPSVITKRATLDKGGAHEISVNPALDIDGSARTYRFEATVTGPDEQQVTSTTTVKALPPFILGMKLDRYLEKATEIKPQLIAVGVDDKLLAGQEVTVRLFRRVWHSNLRETHFASGTAKYVTEQEDVKLVEKTVTTAKEALTVTLPTKEAGVYVVELVARDKLGRVQTLQADLYIGGKGAIAWQKSREGIFNLSTDKKEYVPGETARVIIESPFQTGRALVIVEEPGGNTYTWQNVEGGKAVHEIKVGPQHVPNLPLHVVLMRGRIGEGTSDDSRYRPQTLASSLDLQVKKAKNEVVVGLDFPETARPGSKINVKLTLKDDQAKPLAGEVTLWLVDEAVLSLSREQTLDPLSNFITFNQRTTSVRDTRNLLVGKVMEQEEDNGGDGEEEEGAGRSKRVVRKNFQTVPYYQATLQVPASGELVVPITLSDDLTNFRVRAVAAAGWTRFGKEEKTLRVRLPLIVQPQLPRFIREGDRFWAGGIARLLEGAEGAGEVDIELAGPVDGQAKPQGIDLKNNVPNSVLFPLTAKTTNTGQQNAITVKVGVTRKADGQGDAFEVKLPVLPDRTVERFAYFDRLKPGTVDLKPFPETPRPGTASQQIVVTSTPGILELAASLDYLISYPHGCLEQRVSQVMPEISQGGLLRTLGLDEGYGPKAMLGAKKVLEELATFQDQNGLFAFWPGSPGDIQLTAEVLQFLVAARKAGLPVDSKVETRASTALKRVLRSDYNGFYVDYRWNQQTIALRALAKAGLLDDAYLIDLYQHRKELDATALADLTAAMSVEPQRFGTNLEQLKQELWSTVSFKLYRGQKVFDGLDWRRRTWWPGYLDTTTSSLAAVFQSLLLVSPADERQSLLRDALVAQADADDGFGSTWNNYRAIEALATYLEKARDPQPTVKVSVGERQLSLDTSHRVSRAVFQADAPQKATVSGAEVGARVSYMYLPAAPGTHVTAQRQGFIVSRSSSLVKPDGTMAPPEEDKVGATRRLNQGDILELHARIQAEEEKFFVALVVPFAAGLEPMNPELQTSGSDARPSEADSITATYVQRLDNEVRYYFNRLPRGTHTLHFRVRAATEGSFVHPAPWAELMYKQDVRGRGEGMRVIVAGAHEK